MKKKTLVVFLCLSLGLGVVQAQSTTQLKIDFNIAGGVTAAGYQGYFATDKNAASFTAQSYSAFGTTVTIQPTWVAGANANALRMIDRSNDAALENSDLLRDWIGTDTRTTPADPMTLTIKGLPAGTYEWLSYHHDHNDQTGIFSVTVNDAAGSKTTDNLDISNGASFKLADVTKFKTTIKADGKNDVTLVFHQTSASSVVANAIFVMNAFEMTRLASETAIGPRPANRATDVLRDGTILSWQPADKAVAQEVYLATTFDAIDDATTTSKAYRGHQDANSYDPGRLELGQSYYWRVDQVGADNKVVKGDIWSFTAEPVGVALSKANITATASSSNKPAEGPANTIDGSGLSPEGQHGIDTATMWLSAAADPGPVWIQYEFDKLYKLHQMLVWNHNTNIEPLVGFGVKTAAVAYSTDGATWTTLNAAAEFAQATGVNTYTANTTVDFGDVTVKYVRITVANNWGGLMKQFGLSEVRFLVIPVTARQPVPAVGATGVDPRLALSWRSGREAAQHRVYLSADANSVRNGTTLAGTVSSASFDASKSLQLGQTYYWKITEVNEAVQPSAWEGDVWSFSTAATLTVDDMESYNDAEDKGTRIYETWIDGFGTRTNGSQVGYDNAPFADTKTFHGGKQSMPFRYDNTTAKSSEATRTFAAAQDWTQFGIKGLTLWFYGDPNNTAATLYVKVNGVKAAYDGGADMLSSKGWHFWYIDLASLAGVNLKKVTDLTLGFEGGKGIVLFDDIALTAAARQLVTPVKPAATNLVAHYLFDGNVTDATGAHPGTVAGAPTYTAGKVGQAIKFDGARDYVFSEGTYNLPASYTVAMWFRVDGGTGARMLFSCYDELVNHGILIEVGADGRVRFLHRSPVSSTAAGTNVYSSGSYTGGVWYHVAAVKSATTMTLYINGDVAGSGADSTFLDKNLARLQVGMLKHTATSDWRYLPGAVDDLYLYGRDLSQAEIATLAGRTQPFDKP